MVMKYPKKPLARIVLSAAKLRHFDMKPFTLNEKFEKVVLFFGKTIQIYHKHLHPLFKTAKLFGGNNVSVNAMANTRWKHVVVSQKRKLDQKTKITRSVILLTAFRQL